MIELGPIITAMITPFDARGELHLREAERIAGSTGEGQTLSSQERAALFGAVKEAVNGRAAVIANAGTNDTRDSVQNVQAAQQSGADAILAVVPYYNKPTQSGMLAHFGAVAESTDLPVIIYNIPGRTGANMLPATLLELARTHKNVIGVKESSGDLLQIAGIIAEREPGFLVYSGDDHLFLPCLAMGADGIVGVASHLCSLEYARMLSAHASGNVREAASIHLSLLPLIRGLFATTNPIAVKWAMREIGFDAGECRLPLDTIPRDVAEVLRPLLQPYRAVADTRL